MKKIATTLFVLFCNLIFSQIIKGEETYYSIMNEGKEYSTYHYVQSDYSSRTFQIFVTSSKNFEKIKHLIPKIFLKKPKQDFTDAYVLGILDFDKNYVTDIDERIINIYVEEINKYRTFYNLPTIEDKNFLAKNIIHFVTNESDLCSYMICEPKTKK